MKKRIAYFITIMALCISSLNGFAQKKLSEATISYDIVINSDDKTAKAADMLDGAMSIVYLKGLSSRTEMISSLGTESTIFDGKTGNVTMLREYGDQKFMINLTPDNWKSSNKKYDGVTYNYEETYKTIAGYKCQKATGKLSDGSTFTVYFTRELEPLNRDFQYINKQLPGLAMQYEAVSGSRKITYTVSNINFSPVPAVKFDLPKSGYRILPYVEK